MKKINVALESIRPYLEADGGNVRVVKIDEEKNVFLELLGNCSSCPMSTMTLKAGVEEAIKREVPEVNSVHAVNVIQSDEPGTKSPFTHHKTS